MNAVYLDTVGLIALWDRDDQWHAPVEAAYRSLTLGRRSVLTTSFVLAECGNAAARTPYRPFVTDLKDQLEPLGRVIHPNENDWRSAWEAYRKGEAGDAGMVDHLSFSVMRRLGLTEAFTNDRHFRAAGMVVLF